MRKPSFYATLSPSIALAIAVVACGGGGGTAAGQPDASDDASASDGASDGTSTSADASDGAMRQDGVSPAPDSGADAGDLVQRLLTLTSHCTVASNGQFSIHQGSPPSIDICRLNGAFFWNSSMNVDCDGQTTAECSSSTDPAYQNDTSFHQQSDGKALIASVLPYVVIPLPSSRFDYMASNIKPGALVIVIYNHVLQYGVFGDEGPVNLLGEASYAMAKSVGVNPDPANGGVDSGATYIVITGAGAVVAPIESHQAAVTLGQQLAMQLLQNN